MEPTMEHAADASEHALDDNDQTHCSPAAAAADLQQLELQSTDDDCSSPESVSPPTPPNAAAASVNGDCDGEAVPAGVDGATVRVLDGPNSSGVWLIGTAHFSAKSQADVAALVHHVRPHVLMLELCAGRAGLLHMDEASVRRQMSELSARHVVQMMRSQGAVAAALHVLLLHVSARLADQLGMTPGGELRRAYRESLAVQPPHPCLLHLGDRPINVTLRRALAGLGAWQTARLAYSLLTSNTSLTAEEVERCKERDMLESMMQELAVDFPSVGRVFVDERDQYLSGSLWRCCLCRIQPADCHTGVDEDQDEADEDGRHLSPMRGYRRRVLAVVGMGHLDGMVRQWGCVSDAQMRSLLEIPAQSRSARLKRSALRLAVWTMLGYAAYRWCPARMRNLPAVGWLTDAGRRSVSGTRQLLVYAVQRVTAA